MSVVVDYSEREHRSQVDAWCDARGMSRFPAGWLPRCGLIVPGVAALWVYLTDSDVAFVENVISNPETTGRERGAALDALQAAVEERAAGWGSRYLVGSSQIERVIERARAHGYSVSAPIRQLVKRLEVTS